MIELKHLSGGGGAYAPIRSLNCKLNNGGVIGVPGDEGAGASTLLALLSGALLPREGTLKINGFDTRHERARVASLIGYLPHGYEPDGKMTPMECLLFAADMHGAAYERALRRAQELLETIGLLSKRDTLIWRLSIGERRLLAVAQVLMSAPEFIILDLPFSGLGPRAAQILGEWILQMGENATVFVSARALCDLERICSRVMILHDGTLVEVCEGRGADLLAACSRVLASTPSATRQTPTAPSPKKKSRWSLLTDSTKDYEIIDDGREGSNK